MEIDEKLYYLVVNRVIRNKITSHNGLLHVTRQLNRVIRNFPVVAFVFKLFVLNRVIRWITI